jgi:hypothetical protein
MGNSGTGECGGRGCGCGCVCGADVSSQLSAGYERRAESGDLRFEIPRREKITAERQTGNVELENGKPSLGQAGCSR